MAPKRPPALDRIDIRILAALQKSGRMTIKDLAELVGLSARPCLERVRRLEAAGTISGYRAVIDLAQLSRPVTVFAEIALEKHGRHEAFEQRLGTIEDVVECWEVTGASDYLAHFVCPDLARYEALTNGLINDASLGVARIVSHIVLRPVRKFGGYPTSLMARAPS
jgi:DNA-binding Lrp family transcriptional regulator